MQNYEKLGLFYLGKKLSTKQDSTSGEYYLYDSRDLTTHGVCVGMTGSGKTGLCITLLEETAIDNIPAIIIDPKGDMGNLLLTFPELNANSFKPWVNPDEANRKNLSLDDYARQQAELWKNGLTEWSQDEERIKKFRQTTELRIYTPGSNAGIPISILNSFTYPGIKVVEDSDLFNERIQSTTSCLLELLGIQADPLQSREHILISNIILKVWSSGQNLDLGKLIEAIQNPPLQQIGVFNIESFYPAAERFKLAMALNNLLAAPTFQSWLEGEALDIDRILYAESGKPRLSIFAISHLSESERMFFVTLLLNQILSWMRTQSGTTTLRALLYMDELFGYMPPIGNPPSKRPLLTLLKQARAFGIGVLLATQNPVDLDYKALSNAGTWFIGRLQTERDIERLIDGLSTSPIMTLNRGELSRLISTLAKRQFLVKNINQEQPALIQTRWALSYLRGPLTRDDIKALMQPLKEGPSVSPSRTAPPVSVREFQASKLRPQIDPAIRQYFAPLKTQVNSKMEITYHPYLIAGGDIQLFQNTYGIAQTEKVAHYIKLLDSMPEMNWEMSKSFSLDTQILGQSIDPHAAYGPIPEQLSQLRYYNNLDKQYEEFVYQNYHLTLLKSNRFKVVSKAGESERDFRIRLDLLGRERRDLEIDRFKRQISSKMKTLENQLLTARHQIERESDQYKQKQLDMAVSFGSSLLGALFGGTKITTGVGRTARSASKIAKEKQDINRAEEKMKQLQIQMDGLNRQLEEEIQKISEQFDVTSETFQEIIIRPNKTDIIQKYYGILWIPYILNEDGSLRIEYPELAQTSD